MIASLAPPVLRHHLRAMLWRVRPAWSRNRPPADFILPAQAVRYPVAPTGADWIHEVKHDGYRLVARKDGERVRLWTRQAVDYTERFQAIADAVRALPVEACILDGEAVAYSDTGYDFHALRSKLAAKCACMIAFDMMSLDGEDLRERPLQERRKRLKALLSRRGRPALMYSTEIHGEGGEVFAHACALGLEGIVSKRLGSRYRSGKCDDWRKIKNPSYVRLIPEIVFAPHQNPSTPE